MESSKPIELWLQGEPSVGQEGTLTRVWAERGTNPWALRER
jgi:hypothetical protein